MKTIIALAFCVAAIGIFMNSTESEESLMRRNFDSFLYKYGKSYNDADEYEFRYEVFQDNLLIIADLNERNPHATFGINKFADWTDTEKQGLRNRGHARGSVPDYGDKCLEESLPSADGAVSWVKLMDKARDQGSCGGCWAFSVSGVLEGQYAISQGLDVVQDRFSPQFFVDCNRENSGCGGGFEAYGFKWAETHDVCLDSQYPYKGRQSSCKFSGETDCGSGIRPSACYKVAEKATDRAIAALHHGVVDVAIDASDVMHYTGGIMTDCRNRGLDHAIMGVAYDPNDGQNGSVTIRNSWGYGWGEDGNFRVDASTNACGWNDDIHFVDF